MEVCIPLLRNICNVFMYRMKSGISLRGFRCYGEKRTKNENEKNIYYKSRQVVSKISNVVVGVHHNYMMIFTVLLIYLN